MGLDGVELVMKVEETFDITISDADAEKIITVGDLHRYVLARVGEAPPAAPGCLSAAAFYRLRRELMRRFRIERRRIRPAVTLNDLFPKPVRKERWRQLSEATGWTLPELEHPDWVVPVWLALMFGLTALVLARGRWAGLDQTAGPLLFCWWLVGAVLVTSVFRELARPFATVLPAADVRGLIPMILVANSGMFRSTNPHGWNTCDVWDAIVAIVCEQMGVTPDRITESTSFVQDLGMD